MPTSRRSDQAGIPRAALVAGAAGFAVLATLNAGGYRFGASDQAFYIPAILHQLDPALYPRDWPMLGAQGRYFFVDEAFAWLVRTTGFGLPQWFLIAQAATLALLYSGALLLGRAVLSTPWALTAWVAALTLRHRIAKTGVNTLEGYFHPRVLVCGIGLVAVGLFLRGRPGWALTLSVASAALHPTTAACFVAIIGVGVAVTQPRARGPLLAVATAGAALAGVGLWRGAGAFDVTVMDPDWRALLATKDYVFPGDWSAGTWTLNLLGPVALAGGVVARRRAGLATPEELGILAGCLLLVAGFVASLPLVAGGVALAVQLQTSRVFWPVELLGTLYAVWWLVDRPASQSPPARWPRAVGAILVLASLGRGTYVGLLETPGRPVFAPHLPADDWSTALDWVRTSTPVDTFVLADPGHAWKFGTAVRIGARRDVFLEETKDVAMAMYSKPAAERIRRRIDQAVGFADMDEAALQRLAAGEGLDVLVTERPLALPVLHRAGAVRIYRLRP